MKNFNNFKLYKEIAQDIIDRIEDFEGTEPKDLHYNLFNTDYYICGIYEAKKWLAKYDTFKCIEYIKEWEKDYYGEIQTDFSDPEKVANMLVYIIGDEILNDLKEDNNPYNIEELDEKTINSIKKELKEEYID